jgi:serine carboxypeptidase-like clade 4
MGRSTIVCCLCSILFFSLLFSVEAAKSRLYNVSPGRSPRFPQGQAEHLIKSLGLLPGAAEESHGPVKGPGLQERKLVLDIGDDSAPAAGPRDAGHYAGYFNLNRNYSASMFYTFFESRGNKAKDPLILMMTGGPGCGSEQSIFFQNGPFKIEDHIENLTLSWNEFGWDKEANIIFVDQPLETGFSYSSSKTRHEEEVVSEDIFDFFQAFFVAHPEFAKNDLFVMGESYGGYYVPAVSARLHQANKLRQGLPTNLKGFAIGSGLTHPSIRYEAYADYALKMGLIADDDHGRLSRLFPTCAESIELCGNKGTITCTAAYLVCQSIFNTVLAIAGNINPYDIRKECNEDLCYDFSNMENYLNYGHVREALGVGDQKLISCSPLVYEATFMEWMKNKENLIPALLEDGLEVLVYAGDFDFICNWLGNSRWAAALSWSGQREYAKAPWRKFEVDGSEAGLVTGFKNLNFVKVKGAGHLVAMDQPRHAFEMFRRWLRGVPLGSSLSEEKPDEKQMNPRTVFLN